jgi:predicted dithiol-disulfide oxidoreductase (DUF899 family)
MHEITKPYRFEGPDGEVTLLDLFEGRRQHALYHFMFGPNQDEGCDGCSMFVDQIGRPAHLRARDTTIVLVSRASVRQLEAFKQRMGWDQLPWYSDGNGDFGVDFGFSSPEPQPDQHQNGEIFGFYVFLHDDDGRVYRTYFSNWRAVEAIGTVRSILDRTPLGRYEDWEDTPEGRPHGPKFVWWSQHDASPHGPPATGSDGASRLPPDVSSGGAGSAGGRRL